MKPRQIKTWYTDSTDTEHDITVTVTPTSLREVELSELPDMPADEARRVTERATEAYWEAEREAFACSAEGEAEGL